MFYKEFLRLCNEADQTPTGAAKAMGFAGANVNKWKNGSIPTDVTLLKIAKHFGLPENYFDAFKPQKEKSPTPEGVGPNYSDKQLLDAFRDADEVTKELIRRALKLK